MLNLKTCSNIDFSYEILEENISEDIIKANATELFKLKKLVLHSVLVNSIVPEARFLFCNIREISINHSDLQTLSSISKEITLFEKCLATNEKKIPVVEFEAYKEREIGNEAEQNETVSNKCAPLNDLFSSLKDFNLRLLALSNDTRNPLVYHGALNESIFNTNRWSNLTSMYLSGFKIHRIDANAFVKLATLKNLSLSILELESVDVLAFSGLNLLEELDLTGNNLEAVELGTFDSLQSLKKLYLTSNKVKCIEPGLFSKLNNLVELSLSYNPIESFNDDSFSGLDKLEYLCLSGIPIDIWLAEKSTFLSKHLKSIKRIKLNHQSNI